MVDAIAHGQGPGAGKEDPAGLGARSTAPFCVSASVMGKIYIYIRVTVHRSVAHTHFRPFFCGYAAFPNLQKLTK